MKLLSMATVAVGFVGGMFLADAAIAQSQQLKCDTSGSCVMVPYAGARQPMPTAISSPGFQLPPPQQRPELQRGQQPAAVNRGFDLMNRTRQVQPRAPFNLAPTYQQPRTN